MRVEFDDVTLDTAERVLVIRGETVHLTPRVFATLQVLVERHDRVVSRDELRAAVWPDTHVDSNSVSQAVRAVRGALASSRAAGRVRTLPRQGYRFDGPVTPLVTTDIDETPPSVTVEPGVQRSVMRWRRAAAACAVAAVIILAVVTIALREREQRKGSAVLYQEGLALMATRTAPDLRRAIDRFTAAVAADERNYDALTALATAQYLRGFYGVAGDGDGIRLARAAATEAIRLDPYRAPAYAVRASITLDTDWDLGASGRDFGRAIRLDPEDALTRHWAAWWCLAAGRMSDARAAMDAAVRLDPFSAPVLTARATFAYLDGDLAGAAVDAERALELDPQFFRAHLRLGLVQLASGEIGSGLERLAHAHRLAPDVSETAAALAHAYAVSGAAPRARALLAAHEERFSSYDRAVVLTGLGQYEPAIDALHTARRKGQLVPGLFAHEPRLAPLRAFPRFQALGAATQPTAQPSSDLRVVSYNIRHGRGNDDVVDLERTASVLRALQPDIVGLQEVDDRATRSGGVAQAERLGGWLGLHHAYGRFMDFQGGGYGMAILTRHPIVATHSVRLPDGNEPRVALSVETRLPDGRRLTFVNVHFDWVRDDGFRFAQAEALAKYLDGLTTPYVLLGDFNDVPESRTLALFKSRATEARKPASGRFTFSSTEPVKEIDYIFFAPPSDWRPREVRTIDERVASDHRPLLAVLERPR